MNSHAIILLAERLAFPVGSPDWTYRTRAAWRIDQMGRGIPIDEQTAEPPQWFGVHPNMETAA